ncbi:PilN domain-containing protein [Acinetobacter calcoaceticus]|uniref:PilN domain-containing protein n=1 Tax=Acinetobacter calcoaceticus TaxID=471 RepID=UPI001AE5CA86|nr:PilN domain-containing protein [Acinetobacter calcoaceticus]MBP2604474.1 type IV pilus assembly protein PilN [Acinetobacter calcoaceticus]
MATINLLPWRDGLREQRKKQFIIFCFGVVVLGITTVFSGWFYLNQKLNDQEQANQLITSTNQSLDQQLKTLNGLQEQRDAIIERMKLIQGLQSQRPVVVRLVDELVHVTPAAMYLTKFSRTGDKFTIEGKAESPNTVAELLRNLEASPWYRNAFMNSFLATEEKKDKTASSLLPRVEDSYGSFVVTVDVGEMGVTTTDDTANTTVSTDKGAVK